MDAKEFAKNCFRKYYAQHADAISVPALGQREFGFGWQDKIDYRHKAFAGERDFREFLKLEAPLYASYSIARYSLPAGRPMQRKGFLGADLAFDLDKIYEDEHADRHNKIICDRCLSRSREDGLRFYEEFLSSDFGFAKSEVAVNFSGNKGFHFHVRTDAVQQLGSNSRKELCDYAAAFEVSADSLLYEAPAGRVKQLRGPAASDGGWNSKVFAHAKNFLEKAGEGELIAKGLSRQRAAKVLAEKSSLLGAMSRGNWDYLPDLKDFWAALADESIRAGRVELDKPVSFDLARLIRIPNTLHGSSGFVAKQVSRLQDFEPLRDALAFPMDEQQKVVAIADAAFELGGEAIEVKASEEKEIALSAAVLLALKGIVVPA